MTPARSRQFLACLVAPVIIVGSATACSKKTPTATPTQAPVSALPACVLTSVPTQNWPIEVPADLPKPASSKLSAVTQESGITIVRFDTSLSLREGLVPLLKGLRSNGFEIGRGDAEAREADVPFARQGVRGIFKLVALGQCRTTWILGITRKAGPGSGPVLPGFSPPASAQPLPFS